MFFVSKTPIYNASDPSISHELYPRISVSALRVSCALTFVSSHTFFCYSAKFNKTKTRIIKTWHNFWFCEVGNKMIGKCWENEHSPP